MKTTFLTILLGAIFFLAGAQTKDIWTCSIHPQITADKGGKCPVCGMSLVKKNVRVNHQKRSAIKQNHYMQESDSDTPKEMDMRSDSAAHSHDDRLVDSTATSYFDQTQNMVDLSPGKTVRYDLYVKDTMVDFTGREKHAVAINGFIPGPALVFTEGDTAEIYLHNMLKEETSLHWHGVILPNQADGVPFLTTAPVYSGQTHLYKFKVVQNGTYWYHSHSALQEQAGMYGALLFKSKNESHESHHVVKDSATAMAGHSSEIFNDEYTVVLSEWTDEHSMQVQRRLRTANDWYAIKKGSTQSYAEAIKEGHLKTKLTNEWKRMKAMDVSDVYYDRFLINGNPIDEAPRFKAGDKIKLKVVNAGASTYFWLNYGGGKITVIGNDGNDMQPVNVDRLIIAPAETYDLVVNIPEDMNYEFRATSEDRTGYASLWLGSGHKMPARTLPRLKYFEGMKMMNDMMKTNGTMNDMGMQMSNQKMDMNSVMYPELVDAASAADTMPIDHADHNMNDMHMNSGSIVTLNYDMLRSPVNTSLPTNRVKTLYFTLTGNMNRYLWTLDNKTITESDKILIEKGEVLKVILTNNSMMRHPMHLHGHDFRVVNSQGDYAPLKNVIDIMPMEADTIEFAASQSGNWFFHCHILFHMMAGMGRVFTYANSTVNPELPDAADAYKKFKKHKDQNMKHLMIRAGIESNGSDGEFMYSSNRYALQGLWHLGYTSHHGYEGEVNFGRYLGRNQWWYPYVGYDYHYKKEEGDYTKATDYKNMFGQISNKNDRNTFTVGIQYTTPWLLIADARVDGDGKFRFQLSREEIPLTSRLRFAFMGNTDKEYMVGLRYIVSKWFALSSHYDSDMGLGAGVTLTY